MEPIRGAAPIRQEQEAERSLRDQRGLREGERVGYERTGSPAAAIGDEAEHGGADADRDHRDAEDHVRGYHRAAPYPEELRVSEEGKPALMSSVPEAELKKTEAGLVVESEGWFVVNARDVSWVRSEERGQDTDFEGRQEWTDLGFRIQILSPGQRGLYHGERGQEDFLVVSGECVLVIEGEERHVNAWDFVHCPPWTKHTFVGAGEGPCVIVMAGSRAGGFEVVYAVNDVAAKHGASVLEETSNPDEAYARFGPEKRSAYREGWLPS
jgi:uncharacterized cupin superfamily protein